MIGKTTEVNSTAYTYKVQRDHGTTEFVRTYEVGVFSKQGGRVNILVESTVEGGSRVNVGSIVIPLPDTTEEREALIYYLSTIIREA
jgi:hypothetical protein